MAHFDGGSRGNPGPAAAAAVLELAGHEPVEVARFLGVETNNVAEYNGVLLALEAAAGLGVPVDEVVVRGDSQLVVKQLSGEWRVNDETLAELVDRCVAAVRRLGCRVRFEHVPRARNRRADALVNRCLDEAG